MKNNPYTKAISLFMAVAFTATSINTPGYAQVAVNQMPWMPKPGVMIHLSPEFTPAVLRGITIHPDNPLMFDFIIHRGDQNLSEQQKQAVYKKLIKYFLASLAIPDENQWVNLSPYEKNRIIKADFGRTEMGRDLLTQDYVLKQITASLIYPEDSLGKKFWSTIYSQAQLKFGTTEIPVNTFNKVWIVPADALVYEKGNTAYVIKNHLRVMLEQDYLSLSKHTALSNMPQGDVQGVSKLGSQVVREIVLPDLEKEVNEGKNFAMLRQVYSGMILAAWFKRALKESLLGKIYDNKARLKGIYQNPKNDEEIYHQYLKAYKKGVFNYIKEDFDQLSNQPIPRKYFSGGTEGMVAANNGKGVEVTESDRVGIPVVAEEQSEDDVVPTALEEDRVANLAAQDNAMGVQSQDDLNTRISQSAPQRHGFIKDAPILGYRITSNRFEDLPSAIRDQIGAVDQTKYTPEYLGQNIGSIIALQMNGDKPDFYIVGKSTFDQKYNAVEAQQVGQKNAKVFNRLMGIAGIKDLVDVNDANLIGALKTVPVEMVKMSEIGYNVNDAVTIQSPWGEQTKPAGQDAYLTFDGSQNMYYMVNSDATGNPISYVKSDKAMNVQSQDDLNTLISQNTPQRHGFIKDAPILGYRISSEKFEDIPAVIREQMGAVDQTKYTPEYLRENMGSIIALQMNGDKPDFYIVGKATFDQKYRAVDVQQVSQKNTKTFNRLMGVAGVKALVDEQNSNLTGALKTVPVEMIKMSEIGYPVADAVTIQSPWGEQTKPAGQDAYLTFDGSQNMYYMVNSDAEGNPISYVTTSAPNKAQLSAQITSGDLEKLAELSKQIRGKTISEVPYSFKQVNFDASSREAYLDSTARYFEQQYGFPAGSLTVSFPAVAPLSGNEVLFISKDGKPLAVIKIFLRTEEGTPFGGEALREIESSVLLRNRNIRVPEIYDVVSVNNIDVHNQNRPLMIVSSLAEGGDFASRLRVLIKADSENNRNGITSIIEESRAVGEALAKFHDSFSPPTGVSSINNDYDYNRMKQSIEKLYSKGEINEEEQNKLNNLVDGLFGRMEKSGIKPVAVHGDFHGGNVFIKDGKVSDFIDTETVFWSLDSEYRGIGNPANDLARFLDNLHDRLIESTVSTYIINALEEAFLEGYTSTRHISKESLIDAIEFYKARTALVALQYSPSEFAKVNAKRRLRAYLNNRGIAELTEKLANDLHEGWRSPRRLPSSDYRVAQGILFEPRPKPLDSVVDQEWLRKNTIVPVYDISKLQEADLPTTWSEKEKLNAMREKGKIVIDIANTSYKDLPPSWQSENRNAAESGTRLIARRLADGKKVTLEDKEWIEQASAIIHREWLKRPANAWALNDPDLNKEYNLLSEEQKEKNRDIIIQGIKLFNPLDFISSTDSAMVGVQSQVMLTDRITKVTPQQHSFIKDAPIMGYRITSDSFDALPAVIREQLGAVDQTKYTPEYLGQNIGSIIALQMNGDKPDFYIVGKSTFDQKYKAVGVQEVGQKNVKVFTRLNNVPGVKDLIDSNDPNLVGALKTSPVEMIKMSEIGYSTEDAVTIESPWGEQTKPTGQDAFLTWDGSQNMYYMVNSDAEGNPLSYVKADKAMNVQSQDDLNTNISQNTPQRYGFIKDAPILGYQITSDHFEDIPTVIRDQIGAVDQTKYTPEYLRENIGSIIALQMNGDKPDFYIVGKSTFDQKYKAVGMEQVGQKNAKVFNKLMAIEGLKALADENNANLIGALKTVPVEMIKMSEIGYAVSDAVTIQSPWGEQTKPAGQDAYLTFDSGKNMYYMVNSDADGNPLSYVKTDKAMNVQSQDDLNTRISQNTPQRHGFIKDAPILGYRITSNHFEDIPSAIRDQIGAVDQTKYTPEYLGQNIGSIIALQMNGDKPDFYIVGKATFDQKYKAVEVQQVGQKNAKVFNRLLGVAGVKDLVDANDANLVGALKTVPVEMIRMSEVGYNVSDTVTIQSPWGEQTKPAGQDAYLTFDGSQNMYYMVNSDAEGNPLSYVKADKALIATRAVVHHDTHDPLGGIDFNAANLNLQIKRDGKGVPLPISRQDLENIKINGLIPIIIEIKPATATPLLSELQGAEIQGQLKA